MKQRQKEVDKEGTNGRNIGRKKQKQEKKETTTTTTTTIAESLTTWQTKRQRKR